MENSNVHPFWMWVWRALWFVLLASCVGIIVIPIIFSILVYLSGY